MSVHRTLPSVDADFGAHCQRIMDSMAQVVDGKPEAIQTALVVLLAGGHLLVEDVPGVGKTMLAKALGRSVDCTVTRIQFTPDLLPSDVTGVSVFSPQAQDFSFHPGPVFANIVIADEINRANAKTQAALLECMEEQQVTVDSVTHRLQQPFMVMATQNPIDAEGTFALPEAQRDRFMARISMGYPARDAEVQMLRSHHGHSPLEDLSACLTLDQLQQMITQVQQVEVSARLAGYVVDLGRATREHQQVTVGASPRALLQWVRAAKSHAAVSGRDHVLPEDVRQVAPMLLGHRLILSRRALAEGTDAAAVINEVLNRTMVGGVR
ncbi:MoxR family ATPase [Glutamicibacter sp. MNS18]|uniref:AAA family ATPase n=1 Tax=Glutamicibacter sp. MNS18 TaxID=2989817 RepID=UPI0022361466|nr:MoxR family ATPase [Glutamicibacter sp. MNS18]MCW4465113.1 MoxR family ATPase [Glutamicibacter sp. MNS18]